MMNRQNDWRFQEIEAEIKAAGEMPDEALDVARLALAFAEADEPGRSRETYETHLDEMVEATRAALAKASPAQLDDAEMLATVLANIVSGRFAYRGDEETYDDLKNADIMHVIDRRKGLPVALGVLYLHIARALGINLAGLNFPGHFVLHLRAGAQATIIDPFNRGETLSPANLLALLRRIEGPAATLTPDLYAPVSPRDILLRLQNNILTRALAAEDHTRARIVLTRMIWLAPTRAGLHFELGRLEVHAGHMAAAAQAFEACIRRAHDEGEQRLADMADEALKRLRTRLN
ncbi:MAG: transglutaminase-like domain-containing protein [Parvibaculum sp.]